MVLIDETITINAPLDHVWSIFSDFTTWPTWNTFIHSVRPQNSPPQTPLTLTAESIHQPVTLTITISPDDKPADYVDVISRFEPTGPKRVIAWKSTMYAKWWFDVEHWFELEQGDSEGTTVFRNVERFDGVMVNLLRWMGTMEKLREAYVRMNGELKGVAEGKVPLR